MKQLTQEETRLYVETIKIYHSLEKELDECEEEERKEYLKSMIILLKRAIKDMESDLDM